MIGLQRKPILVWPNTRISRAVKRKLLSDTYTEV